MGKSKKKQQQMMMPMQMIPMMMGAAQAAADDKPQESDDSRSAEDAARREKKKQKALATKNLSNKATHLFALPKVRLGQLVEAIEPTLESSVTHEFHEHVLARSIWALTGDRIFIALFINIK